MAALLCMYNVRFPVSKWGWKEQLYNTYHTYISIAKELYYNKLHFTHTLVEYIESVSTNYLPL